MKNNKLITIMFISITFLLSGGYSIPDQNELLNWQFEEGAGSIVFDSSGNNFNGLITGANFDNNPVRWGTYSMYFDGSNDYITSLSSTDTPFNISVSLWVRIDEYTNDDYWVEIDDTTETFELEYSEDTHELKFGYFNNAEVLTHQVIDTTQYPINTWIHVVIGINSDANTISYWRDNTQILNNTPIVGGYNKVQSIKSLRIGVNHAIADDFRGWIDSLRIMDFVPNSSQVTELYNSNIITLFSNQNPSEVNQTIQDSIISYSTPDNISTISPVEFELVLNTKASCDFYLDNNLLYSFEDILAVNFEEIIGDGSHEYFYYCEYVQDSIQYYELSSTYTFNVTTPNTQITFNIVGNDFDVNDLDLWITSPCPVPGFSAVGIIVPYQSKYNPGGIQWEEITNGIGIINLSIGQHEFCLFNGRVIVNELGKTTNYNVQEYNGIVHLGNITIPNLVNSQFTLKIDQFDIWNITNPKAHNTSWSALILPLLLLGLGIIIIFSGLSAQNGKIVVSGVIMALIGTGFSVGGLFAVLI